LASAVGAAGALQFGLHVLLPDKIDTLIQRLVDDGLPVRRYDGPTDLAIAVASVVDGLSDDALAAACFRAGYELAARE